LSDSTGQTAASSTSGSGSNASSSSEGDSSSGSGANGGADASTQIVVSIVRAPLGEYPGLVSVRVPEKIVAAGNGFSFALPKALAEAAASNKVIVSLVDGKPLPSWLRYVDATKTFVATKPPAGGLPIEVTVRIGDKRWTMTIGEFKG
jgi:hypothetical protein